MLAELVQLNGSCFLWDVSKFWCCPRFFSFQEVALRLLRVQKRHEEIRQPCGTGQRDLDGTFRWEKVGKSHPATLTRCLENLGLTNYPSMFQYVKLWFSKISKSD